MVLTNTSKYVSRIVSWNVKLLGVIYELIYLLTDSSTKLSHTPINFIVSFRDFTYVPKIKSFT